LLRERQKIGKDIWCSRMAHLIEDKSGGRWLKEKDSCGTISARRNHILTKAVGLRVSRTATDSKNMAMAASMWVIFNMEWSTALIKLRQ
jgi:hypothetical protein